MTGPPPSSTLFPYPTLSRSPQHELPLLLAEGRAEVLPEGARLESRREAPVLQGKVHRCRRELELGDGDLRRARQRLPRARRDRKSTRLNSSHSQISYAVFCL